MVFETIKRLKYAMYSAPSLDNFIFKLFYRWTVLLLVAFSFVVTCRLLFGDSFECISQDDIPKRYVDTKCYADTTYTLPGKLIIQKDDSPPIDPDVQLKRHQSYYSWVNLFFLLQAFNFYLPHLLWKSYESGYMNRLTAGVHKFFDREEKRGLELCYLAKYVLVTQGKYKVYTGLYIYFEAWNHSMALGHTLLLIFFFNVTGVQDYSPLTLETWSDFRHFYFPPSARCELTRYSPSGSTMKVLVQCELPLNALYMKMFLFLYVWYILLTILSGLVLIYRIALVFPSFRVFVAKTTNSLAERSILNSLCYRMSYTDWFFLTRLQKTMTDIDFAQMIDKIAVVSQGLDKQKDRKSFLFSDAPKDHDSSEEASPL